MKIMKDGLLPKVDTDSSFSEKIILGMFIIPFVLAGFLLWLIGTPLNQWPVLVDDPLSNASLIIMLILSSIVFIMTYLHQR